MHPEYPCTSLASLVCNAGGFCFSKLFKAVINMKAKKKCGAYRLCRLKYLPYKNTSQTTELNTKPTTLTIVIKQTKPPQTSKNNNKIVIAMRYISTLVLLLLLCHISHAQTGRAFMTNPDWGMYAYKTIKSTVYDTANVNVLYELKFLAWFH